MNQYIQPKSFNRATMKQFHSYLSVKPFVYDVCSKCFCEKWHLVRHLWVHTGEKLFKCQFCAGQSFNLKIHMAMKH